VLIVYVHMSHIVLSNLVRLLYPRYHLDLPIKTLCCTEVELEPASHDHELNKLPLTAAHRAALIDSHVVLDVILTSCPESNCKLETNGYTPLHVAASSGVLACVNYLASERARVEARDADGSTPLHLAAKNGHKDVISVLCVRGGSVNTINDKRQTALHLASEAGYVDTVDMLLMKNAEVNVKDDKGRTPLHLAQLRGHVIVTKKLIGRGANVNEQDEDGNTPLHVWTNNMHQKLKGTHEYTFHLYLYYLSYY
jgi:ankyrin repeat protein